jgi:hypothetical protein
MNTQNTSSKVLILRKVCARVVIASATLVFIAMTGCQSGSIKSITSEANSYAEDRALIEDLQARYMFALDFGDIDKYVATFTEDGILDIGEGEWRSRDTIRQVLTSMPKSEQPPADLDTPKLHPSTGRHNITNIVIKIEGDTAYGRAYWFHMSNNNPQRSATLTSYGHYEDEIVKVNGKWLFSKRKIYNEQVSQWSAPRDNPSW